MDSYGTLRPDPRRNHRFLKNTTMDSPRLIPLAALQHYAFCPRQCALIHNECIWSENWHTMQGALLHERVHAAKPERRRNIHHEYGVAVAAPSLGLTGKLDLLEIDTASDKLFPVEYKKGRQKTEDWDRIQLCAQVLCLEEMRKCRIGTAALWYWQTRRREEIPITDELRMRTREVIDAVRALLESNVLPAPQLAKHCRSCSLSEECAPAMPKEKDIRQYVDSLFILDDPGDQNSLHGESGEKTEK